jgi:membrane protein DedA with SNARE-associated domain
METGINAIVRFVALHPEWAGLVMFAVAFGESLVFVSLLFPGTALLLAAGAFVPGDSWQIVLLLTGAIMGAIAGDGVSFWIGRRYGYAVSGIWPFTCDSELIPSGISFFQRHGGKSVFIGRFFGPVRAVIPLAAGILNMPAGRFWAANVGSAIVWAPAVMLPGAVIGALVEHFALGVGVLPLAAAFLIAVGIVGTWIVVSRSAAR